MTSAQLAFSFAVPAMPSEPGDLADLRKLVAAGVARVLNEDKRDRDAIAEAMTLLLEESVTGRMLDSYASEARADNNIPGHRWLALIAVTRRTDVLDAILLRAGMRALDGDEMATAQLGHLHAQRAEIDEQIRALRPRAKPFGRSRA